MSDAGGATSEGICGQVFSSEMVLSVHDLPDLIADESDQNLEQYAKATYVTKKWLKKWVAKKRARGQKVCRSICGFHVETSSGKPWGVLVLDSASPENINIKRQAEKIYDITKKHLSQLVEKL